MRDKLYLLPVKGSDTQWYKNVLSNPSMQIEAGGAKGKFQATSLTDKVCLPGDRAVSREICGRCEEILFEIRCRGRRAVRYHSTKSPEFRRLFGGVLYGHAECEWSAARSAGADETPLLYVLRNDLQLIGPQFGCGLAQCGACAVLIEGKETRSCVTPVASVASQEIITLEGLPARWAKQKGLPAEVAKNTLHPVQQAWIEEQTPQCGFCQNGMMIKATELLESNPSPTLTEIKAAFTTSGVSRIYAAAEPMSQS